MNVSKITPSVTALALAALTAGTAHAQSAAAVLTVNDPNAVGAPGDALLSFDEAIRLANGTLALGGLSAAERAQVKGAPGAGSRDRIALPEGGTLTVAKGAALSQIVGNDGDAIEGNGALLTSVDKGKGTGITISSSNFVLRNFHGRDFATVVRVEFGGRKLANISLEKLRLLGAVMQSALLEVGAQSSNGSLRGVSLSDSVLDTEGQPGYASLAYITAAKTPPGGTVENVVLDGVRFERNRINGGGVGLYLTGSLSGGRATNAVTRNVLVADNVFTSQHDSPLNLVGALPAMGGHDTKVGLENVVARGNRIESANWGFYTGHEMYGKGGRPGSMTDSFFRNITITKNTVTRGPMGSRGFCIFVETGADFNGDQASGNVVENIKITDNDLTGCVQTARAGVPPQELGAGVAIVAGRAALSLENPGGTARDNVARNIEISNNRIKDSNRGIVVTGGYVLNRQAATNPVVVTGNRLTGLRIEGNVLENNPTGIRLTGGDGPPGTVVTGNGVAGVQIRGNRITGAKIVCETIANAGSATGNTLDAACPAPQR